jgi:hypothetical protein
MAKRFKLVSCESMKEELHNLLPDGICGFPADTPLVVPKAHDCITFFLMTPPGSVIQRSFSNEEKIIKARKAGV